MSPLKNTQKSAILAPPDHLINSRKGVPTGVQNDLGWFTAPTTETNLSVTEMSCVVRGPLYRSQHCSQRILRGAGRPAGGMRRPVAV